MQEAKNRLAGTTAALNGTIETDELGIYSTTSSEKCQALGDDIDALLDENFKTAKQIMEAQKVAPAKTEATDSQQADEATEDEPHFLPMSLDDLLALPPKEWIVDQVLGKGDLAMVYGPPGCGKTFVVIDMVFAACLGQKWAMRFDVERPLNVAYAAGEGVSGLPARFGAAKQHHGVDKMPNFTFFAAVPQMFNGDNTPYAGRIQQFVNEWKKRQEAGKAQPLDILIIDTLHSATAGADENSSQHMGVVLNLAKYAARELGCAVILVHHTNKAGTGERGSSSLRGAMDVMIEIKRESDEYTKARMVCAKLKDGEKWKDQGFDLVEMGESVRVWWYEPNEGESEDRRKSETARAILELLAAKEGRRLTSAQIDEATGIKQQTANKILLRLIKDGHVERDQNERKTWCYWATTSGIDALQNRSKPI